MSVASSILVKEGLFIPIFIDTDPANDLLYPRARLYGTDNTLLTTIGLSLVSNGLYSDLSYPMPISYNNVIIVIDFWLDAGFAFDAGYDKVTITANKDVNAAINIPGSVCNISGKITKGELSGTLNQKPLVGALDTQEISGKIEDKALSQEIDNEALSGTIKDC